MDAFKEIADKIISRIPGLGKDEPMSEMPPPGAPLSDDLVPATVETTLAQRGSRYGKFSDNSAIFAQLMAMFYQSPAMTEGRCTPAILHAYSNIATKLARMLTGDPTYDDNWRDIAGYATLMVRILNGEER